MGNISVLKGDNMTKKELQLKNLVLLNALDRIADYLEICDNSSDDYRYPYFAGAVGSVLSTINNNIKNAIIDGYTLDYRNNVSDNNVIIRLFPDSTKEVIPVKGRVKL